jgi:hypothetical protein
MVLGYIQEYFSWVTCFDGNLQNHYWYHMDYVAL